MSVNLSKSLYEQDFAQWTAQTAELIRAGQFEQVNWEQVAEEIESLGRSDRRELKSRLEVLLQHLLKWQFQPNRRSSSWQRTIDEQRNRITDLLLDSPSLKSSLSEMLVESYCRGWKAASLETGIPIENFPADCPYELEQILDADFLP
jgi:hypothetical protein